MCQRRCIVRIPDSAQFSLSKLTGACQQLQQGLPTNMFEALFPSQEAPRSPLSSVPKKIRMHPPTSSLFLARMAPPADSVARFLKTPGLSPLLVPAPACFRRPDNDHENTVGVTAAWCRRSTSRANKSNPPPAKRRLFSRIMTSKPTQVWRVLCHASRLRVLVSYDAKFIVARLISRNSQLRLVDYVATNGVGEAVAVHPLKR